MASVYILYSPKFDRYYIGSSENPPNRLNKHNSGKVKSTKAYRPWKLAFSKEFPTRSLAQKAEYKLKSLKSKKVLAKIVRSGIATCLENIQ